MTDIAPPDQPGWYADAHGTWWWWDGGTWSQAPTGPAPAAWSGPGGPTPGRAQERTNALLMWVLYLVLGGWIVALVFYLVSSEKPFVRHHAAEALNLTILLIPLQVVGYVVLVPAYIDWISQISDGPGSSPELGSGFLVGAAILGVATLLNYGVGIFGAVKAHRGEWARLPIGVHPVRGVLGKGEQPPYDVGA